ncbi:MAG: TldD/PmbA family protein [Methanolinea sp.]|nr:TldD/PmbA family protein [Methanolinea sp.]
MDLIEKILSAGNAKADEVEIYLSTGRSVTARLKRREISYAAGSDNKSLAIRVISGGKIGVSSTSNPGRWEPCLDAALRSAQLANAQEWKGLPRPDPAGGGWINFDQTLIPDPARAGGLLQDMVEGAGAYPVEITSGSAEISRFSTVLANTNGLFREDRESLVSIGLEAIREQSTGYEFETSWKADIDAVEVGRRAAFLASSSAGGRDIPTGTYDVILSPVALAQLVEACIIPALSGRNVHEGRSRLAPLLGEEVFDPALTLTDDPFHPRGTGSCLWDGEGSVTRRLPFIERGVLRCFAYDLKTAYRYGKESTGSAVRSGMGGGISIGVHCATLDGPRCNLADEEGIWVHDVVGAHTANPLTGDFSVELSNAFLTRGGHFEYPIKSAMLTGNVFEMLKGTEGISREERVVGAFVLPSIRLKNQRIIGN